MIRNVLLADLHMRRHEAIVAVVFFYGCEVVLGAGFILVALTFPSLLHHRLSEVQWVVFAFLPVAMFTYDCVSLSRGAPLWRRLWGSYTTVQVQNGAPPGLLKAMMFNFAYAGSGGAAGVLTLVAFHSFNVAFGWPRPWIGWWLLLLLATSASSLVALLRSNTWYGTCSGVVTRVGDTNRAEGPS